MKKLTPLLVTFFSICFFCHYFPFWLPYTRILLFAPLMTLVFSRLSLPISLWLATLSGLYVDLLSYTGILGLSSLNYVLTTLCIYRFRSYFSEEKIHIFSLYTILFSLVSTLFQLSFDLPLITHRPPHLLTILTDLLLLPIVDGVYALLLFLYPLKLYKIALTPTSILFYQKWWHKFYKFLQIVTKTLRQSNA